MTRWRLELLCRRPSGERLREPVPVRRVRDDALRVDADLVLARDGREQVDGDRRARVDVHDLLLAVERVQAVLAVILRVRAHTRKGNVRISHECTL